MHEKIEFKSLWCFLKSQTEFKFILCWNSSICNQHNLFFCVFLMYVHVWLGNRGTEKAFIHKLIFQTLETKLCVSLCFIFKVKCIKKWNISWISKSYKSYHNHFHDLKFALLKHFFVSYYYLFLDGKIWNTIINIYYKSQSILLTTLTFSPR